MNVFGVTGWKNSGKTTLLERLVKEITGRGLRVSTIKHAHHSTDVDQVGTDSYRHRSAGACEVLLASSQRWALMAELRDDPEPDLSDLLQRLSPVDLVLVEGFKSAEHPKIETHRAALPAPLIAETNRSICAIASDVEMSFDGLPVFDLDNISGIADFILREVGL